LRHPQRQRGASPPRQARNVDDQPPPLERPQRVGGSGLAELMSALMGGGGGGLERVEFGECAKFITLRCDFGG
jgi:hypothetical protein